MKTSPALSREDRVAALRIGGLCDMPGEILDRVAAVCTTRRVLRGEQIHRCGELPDGISWVFSGRVRVCRSASNGREVTIATLRSAGAFGVAPALNGFPFSADIYADSDAALVFLSRIDLLELLEELPRLYAPLVSILCEKLRQALATLEDLACLRLEVRLAQRLLSLTTLVQSGREGAAAVTLAASQDELSQMLGASRQSISKHLRGWQTRGLITIERRRLLIRDYEALKRIV